MRRVLVFAACVVGACADSHAPAPLDAGPPDAGRIDAWTLPSGWTVQRLVSPGPGDVYGPGHWPDLSIDAAGAFHIVHVHQDRGDVLYTSNVSGAWRTETVERGIGPLPMGDPGVLTSYARLALCPTAAGASPYIAYDHGPAHGMTLATGAPWALSSLDLVEPPRYLGASDVACAADGTVFVAGLGSAVDAETQSLRVVGLDGSRDEPDAFIVSADYRTSTLATTDGWLHVAIESGFTTNLVSRSPSGAWTTRLLAGVFRGWPVLAEGPGARLHIVSTRLDTDASSVLVSGEASTDGTGLVETDVLTAPWVTETDVAVDTMGIVHIAFFDDGILEYATNLSGHWESHVIDDEASSQNGMPSLAIDAAGDPWIAYRDGSQSLALATRARGSI